MRKYVTLGDVCIKGSSNIAQKDIENNNGIYAIYGASGYIKNVNFYHQDKPYIAVVKDGAGIGRTMLLPEKTSVIGTLQYLIPNDSISVKYLYYAVTYMNLSKYFTGATIPHIYFKDYQKELLPLPPMEKQLEIARNLEKIDAMIELCNSIVEKMDVLVKSRFVEMFGDPENNPMQWEKSPLSERLNVLGGYAFKSDLFNENVGIPVLRIGNINAGYFRPINMVFWDEDESLARYLMYPGDLVISLTGTVGKDDYANVCILGSEYEKYYLNQRNAKLELKHGLNKYFLSQLLKFESIKKQLTGISRGVRQANVSNKDILNLMVPIPPIDLQEKFATFIQDINKSKFATQKALTETQQLFNSLMQKYFG